MKYIYIYIYPNTFNYTQDFLRCVNKRDIERCLKTHVRPLNEDPALKVAELGPEYVETWKKEDNSRVVSLAVTKTLSASSPYKKMSSKRRLSQSSPNIRKQRTDSKDPSLSIVISPASEAEGELCHCCWNGEVDAN